MLKSLLVAAVFAFSVASHASTQGFTFAIQKQMFSKINVNSDWVVGDTTSYKLNIGGFINGTMVMAVKAYDANGLLLTQDMDLGFLGKQNCEILIDLSSGQTKKMTCNGQDQDPGQAGDIEVIDMTEDRVTVPAGTFDAILIRAKNKSDNSEIKQWVNPSDIPVMGLVKTLAPTQFGEMKVELTSFKKM